MNTPTDCPAYQMTTDKDVSCFITGEKCRYSNKHNCPEFRTYLSRREMQIQRDDGLPSRIGFVGEGIKKAIEDLDLEI